MRSYLPDYELRAAPTLDEALAILAERPGEWRPFAGGTDLMVLLEAGALTHRKFVSLWGLEALRGITVGDHEVRIGALTTYTDVRRSDVLRREFPMLLEAAAQTGGIATQNRGTLGGNIANASPAADTPPALLVYDAELELMSVRGARRVAYDRFHRGYKQMDLAPDEIIAAIHLPRGRSGWIEHYRKVGTRLAQAISKVCFAAAVRLEADRIAEVRVALGSVAPTVVRCRQVESVLTGRASPERAALAVDALAKDIAPIDDVRSTAAYRLTVTRNLLRAFLQDLARRHQRGGRR
jgi:CO/xanthine dehydrogenase FAD-binding subunit